jgi:hypothetical protein
LGGMIVKLKYLLAATMLALTASTFAQTVSGVKAQQSGTSIQISYELATEKPVCVALLHSIDGGYRWIKIDAGLSGDVGFDQTAGRKNIVWNVLQTYEEFDKPDVKFKVEILKTTSKPLWALYNGRTMGLNNPNYTKAFETHVKSLDYPYGRYNLQEVRTDYSTLLRITDYHCTTGPSNAAYSLLLPGLGSLKVTRGKHGWTRMLGAAVTAGVGFYAYSQFTKEYQAYREAVTEAETRSTFKTATNYSRVAICSFGLTFGIGIYDACWAFKKGKENKKRADLNKELYNHGGKVLYEAPLSSK